MFTFNAPLKPKAARWALLAITWAAFLLRIFTLGGQSLWRDEVDAIRFSNWPLTQLLTGLFQTGHNGPLFFLLLRPWRAVTNNSEFALRYPAALLGVLALPLGYILARQLGFSRWVGLLLTLLLGTSPYLVWYGQEAKMYTMLLILVTLAFIAYLKALQGAPLPRPFPRHRPAAWWFIFTIATTLSFYTHILAPLMLPVYFLVGLLHRPALRRHWRGWLISMTCLTLPYLPLVLWQLPLLLKGFQSGHPFYPLQKEIFLLLQLYSSGLIRFAGTYPLILTVFLLLAALFMAPVPSRPRLILAIWLLLPPLLVYLISLRVAVFEDRYLIYLTPPFYLLLALGLTAVARYARFLAPLCLALLLVVNLTGLWQQQSQPLKADFRALSHYLLEQAQRPSYIMVQMHFQEETVRYY